MKKTTLILLLVTLLGPASLVSAAVQAFGIFSPVLGMREDVPQITLTQAYTTDNENVIMQHGEIHRSLMRSDQLIDANSNEQTTPDGKPVLTYYYYEKVDGTSYLLAFTSESVYMWNTSTLAWNAVYDNSTCTTWSVVTFDNILYATNNVDKVLAWEGTGAFSIADQAGGLDIGGGEFITKAKWLATFEGYLLAGNVLAGGANRAQWVYWSDTANGGTIADNDAAGEEWTLGTGNAGVMILPGPKPLLGVGQIENFLLIFSENAIDQLWAVDSTLIFNHRRLRNRLGTKSPQSILNGENGELYFLDTQRNIRIIPSPMSQFSIVSDGIDKTLKLIPDKQLSDVKSFYVSDLQQKWWSIPYGRDATTNNKILAVDRYNAWSRLDMPVSAFGHWAEQISPQYVWTDANSLLPTWEEIGWAWESVISVGGSALDICGDYSGYTYNSHNSLQDNGSDFTGYAIIATDFSHAKGTPYLDVFKRLTAITVFFRNEGSGTATIELKRDMETTWQSVGTSSLSGSTDILWDRMDVDYRARHFQLKISGSNPFRFVGVIFHYVPQSYR